MRAIIDTVAMLLPLFPSAEQVEAWVQRTWYCAAVAVG